MILREKKWSFLHCPMPESGGQQPGRKGIEVENGKQSVRIYTLTHWRKIPKMES